MYESQLRYERAQAIRHGKLLARKRQMDELVTYVLAIIGGFIYTGLILHLF